jgi:hypothetical protein
LSETGVLEQLLMLAPSGAVAPTEPEDAIDDMGVDDLVRAAMNGGSHPPQDDDGADG